MFEWLKCPHLKDFVENKWININIYLSLWSVSALVCGAEVNFSLYTGAELCLGLSWAAGTLFEVLHMIIKSQACQVVQEKTISIITTILCFYTPESPCETTNIWSNLTELWPRGEAQYKATNTHTRAQTQSTDDRSVLLLYILMARFHWAVRFGTVQYGMQLFPFPLSEVVNGTKIVNRTVPLFWYPSVGVPSTAKGTKRVELNSLQNVDWLKGIKLLLHSFRSAVRVGLIYIRVHANKQI